MIRRAYVPFTCCALLIAAASGTAQADLMGGRIDIEVQLPEDDGEGFRLPNEPERIEFFNLARCQCSDEQFAVELTLVDAPQSIPTQEVEIWVGNDCDIDDVEMRERQCEQITTIGDAESLRSPDKFPIDAFRLIGPNSDSCPVRQTSRNVYAMIDDDGNEQTFEEVFVTDPSIFVDTEPPPEPEDIRVRGGEEAISVRWDLPDSRTDDIFRFQLLCARADESVDEADGFPRREPAFLTARNLCGFDGGVFPAPPSGGVDSAQAARGGVDAGTLIDAGAMADAGANPDAGAQPPLPPGLDTLDAMTVCGEAGGTQTSIRVDGLENGVPYRVVLVSADESLNPTPLDLGEVIPEPSVDFWEDYKNSGGSAEGGFCFVATAAYDDYDHPYVLVLRDFRDGTLARFSAGRAFIDWYYTHGPTLAAFLRAHPVARAAAGALLFPVVALAGLWEYTGLFGKLALALALGLAVHLLRRIRRRRPPRPERRKRLVRRRARLAAAGAAGALCLVWAADAPAQPYWEEYDEEAVQPAVGPAPVEWAFEIKFGPYTPDVDSEFEAPEGEVGPFERMYGDGPFLLSQLELDRFFLYPMGQLGVAVSVGFLTTSAPAFQDDGSGNIATDMNGDPVRSQGDSTGFRLIPTSVSGVYRYTGLDDRFGIPLVPYAKAGLSYYIWWFTQPSGSIAEVQEDPNCMPTDEQSCETDRALGGSLGYQASIGLALRAEQLDPSSERALRNEFGIQHAGFFAELTYADVDGFGSSERLDVGDFTWFAGVNFEF